MRYRTTQPRDAPTDRQREVEDFIRLYYAGRGYPPAIRDIGRALGIGSPNGVMCHIHALVRKGRLVNAGEVKGQGRCYVPADWRAARVEQLEAELGRLRAAAGEGGA